MRKKLFFSFATVLYANVIMAGGLLTNTNQHAAFLRNPARDAVISIDGVYSNPAGVAFLPKGFHMGISWQSAFQKRQMTSTAPFYALNTENRSNEHFFEGKAVAPVIPSIQLAYVLNDRWSISAQAAVGGGGGECDYKQGLPMFEQLLGGSIASGVNSLMGGTAPYSYSLRQELVGEQYFYGAQVGATYKITPHLSVFGGVRGVWARCSYVGSITQFHINGQPATAYAQPLGAVAQQATQAAQQYTAVGDAANAQKYAMIAQQATVAALISHEDLILDCSQKGFGVTPILGIDLNLGKWNLAAKYEFRTKIALKNEATNSANVNAVFADYKDGVEVRSDIPSLLTVGAQYSLLDNMRLMGGFHYYFDKKAKGNATNVDKNTWEVTAGTEVDINKWLTMSLGMQRTKYGFDERMQDTNANVSSNALCVGAMFRLGDRVNLHAGYMHNFYDYDLLNRGNGIVDIYTRKNDVAGLAVDLKF